MNVTRKDAQITQAPTDEGPGTWKAILSAPTKDRDGDTLTADGWKQPLPAKIPIDIDHEMSVRGTIGSAVPSINEDGELVVDGTFASTPLAQEVRTLMAEGHIDRMSVAFMSEKTQKDGKTETTRELLNGAVVCIPSNRESSVLAVRSFNVFGKAGARNSKSDAQRIQAIHDHAVALGASHDGPEDDTGAASGAAGGKALAAPVQTDTEDDDSPGEIAAGLDACVDQALALLEGVDLTTLPEEVQQAIALLQAADSSADELLDAMGVPDPDEDDTAKSVDSERLQTLALLTEITAAAWE